jgi:hypothetical protein
MRMVFVFVGLRGDLPMVYLRGDCQCWIMWRLPMLDYVVIIFVGLRGDCRYL